MDHLQSARLEPVSVRSRTNGRAPALTPVIMDGSSDASCIHIDLMPVATVMADSQGRAVAVNQAWTDLTLLADRHSLGRGWLVLLAGDDRLRLLDALLAASRNGTSALGDYRLQVGRECRWTRWASRTNGGPLTAVTVTDIDAERTRSDHLSRVASTDSLTGLVHRGELLRLTGEALSRDDATVGMFYVDLDRFKTVNDTGGHLLGDRVLATAAVRLQAAVRPGDVVGRVGGDEFAVLCPNLTDPDQMELMAARLEAALADPIEAVGTTCQVGATAGAAIAEDGQTAEELLAAADWAMYAARSARAARLAADDVSSGEEGANTIELADGVIRRIFAVGLTLAATVSTVEASAAARLRTALDQLDEVMVFARRAAYDRQAYRGVVSVAGTAASALAPVTERIEVLARQVDELARLEQAAGRDAIPLLDAVHTFHRVRTELAFVTDGTNRPGPGLTDS